MAPSLVETKRLVELRRPGNDLIEENPYLSLRI